MLTRSLVLLMLAWSTCGCGTQFAYDNLDRLVRWSVDDYLSLDDAQQRYLDAELAVFLYWHRTTELPRYARWLRRFETESGDGITREELLAAETELTEWGRQLGEAALPMMTNVLFSTSDAQRDELSRNMPRESEKYVRPLLRRPPDERRERWQDDLEDQLKYLVGRLSDAQRAAIASSAIRYNPDEELWLGYRINWQHELLAVLATRPTYDEFAIRMRTLVLQREQWYGSEYAEVLASNEAVYRDLAAAVFGSLDTRQRAALSHRLLELAEDFEALVAKAGPAPPRPSCLVGCALSRIHRDPGDRIAQQHELRQAEPRQHDRDT